MCYPPPTMSAMRSMPLTQLNRADTKSVFTPFRFIYLLVEDLSKMYRPILIKEYELNTRFPRIHFTTKIPFELADSSCPPCLVVRNSRPYSTPSKLILSQLTPKDNESPSAQIYSRLKSTSKSPPPNSTPRKRKVTFTTSNSKRQRVSAFFTKPGVCENCDKKYTNYYTVHTSFFY